MTHNANDKLSPTRMLNIRKLVPGTLVLDFQDAINSMNMRKIVIDAHRETYRIPLNLAASMFQIEGTYALYKQGYFTFNTTEEKEAVFSFAKNLQIYFEDEIEPQGKAEKTYEQPAKLYTTADFTNMINGGRISQITAVLESGNDAQISLLLDSAIKLGGSIKLDIRNLIEEKTGIGFPEGDE